MESLFQRRFTVTQEEERPKSVPETPEQKDVDASAEPAQAASGEESKSREGLIPASNLPPAADALAQLFGDGPATETATADEPETPPAPAQAASEQPPASAPRRSGFLARLFKRAPKVAEAPAPIQPSSHEPIEPAAAPQAADEPAGVSTAASPVETAATPAVESSAEPVVLAEIPRISAPTEDGAAASDASHHVAAEEPIHAEELPSAATALADLFPDEETVAFVEEPDSTAASADDAAIAQVFNDFPAEAHAEESAEFTSEAHVSEQGREHPPTHLDAETIEFPPDGAKPYPAEAPAVDSASPAGADAAIGSDDTPAAVAAHPAPFVTDSSENLESSVSETTGQPQPSPPPSLLSEPRRLYKDWALDEKLASHGEWVESHGRTGQRADLSGVELEASDLISVNLRLADLHDANLRASDLLLADLRDACLVRADLEEACLVGASLEGANLEGASLETAMGLVPRQLAGANLRDALLSPHLMEFDAVTAFDRESKNSFRYFWIMSALSLLSWLLVAKTRDAQLLADSAVIPFLRSRAAAAALPTAESYLILPVVLFSLYVLFHFHLQRMWDAVIELPAIFPDGHMLGDDGPGIMSGLLRTHFRWMNPDPSSTRLVEKSASLATAYWIVPGTLLLYWVRYLTRQEIHGTVLLALLATAAAGMAAHATLRVGKPQERWAFENRWIQRAIRKVKAINPISAAAVMAAFLLLLSAGVIFGVPHDRGRAPQFGAANIRRWAPDVFWSLAYDPYPDLTEASISRRPANWSGADDRVAEVDGLRANNAKFRYAQAYGAFFANSHLWRADFQGAFLSEADLRGADLGQSSLRYAVMDHAQMNHANLDRSNLDGADMRRADLREANLSYGSLANTILIDARLDGASLYAARLPGATMTRAILEKADLRESQLPAAHMDHADLRAAYLWSAWLPGADLGGAQLEGAILIGANLRGANLGGAQLMGTVLSGTDLSDTSLEGADLRGALGLSAPQVCSAKSRRWAVLDADLETQVEALCGKR